MSAVRPYPLLRSLTWPSPPFAGSPSPPSFPPRRSPRMALSPPTNGARARPNSRHGRGAQARHVAGTVDRRRLWRADDRIRLADLPPLRRVQPRGLSRTEEGLHRHRQGPIHLPRILAQSARCRGLRAGALRRRRQGVRGDRAIVQHSRTSGRSSTSRSSR